MHNLPHMDKVAVSLSGGIDSAILLHMLASKYDYASKTHIYAITGYRKDDTLLAAKYVWTYVKLLFPELKWKKHLSYNNTFDKSEFGHRGKADHELRSPQLKEYKIKHVLHGRVRTTLDDLSKFKDNYSQATNKLDINKTKIETYKYVEPTNKWNYYLHRPISHLFKSHVIQYAINNNIEELLTNTISCYKQTITPCGACPSCVEKMELLGHY